MHGARKLALVLSALLAALAIFDLAVGAPALRLNMDTGFVHAAAALWGFGAVYAGRKASSLFLVAVGLLMCTDAFMGMTRGTFYLSFDAMRGAVSPLGRPDRFIASAPHLALGAIALIAGMIFANRDAGARTGAPPA